MEVGQRKYFGCYDNTSKEKYFGFRIGLTTFAALITLFQPIFMKIQQIYIPMLIRLSRGISHYFSQTAKIWVPQVPQVPQVMRSADRLFNNTQFQSIFLDRC